MRKILVFITVTLVTTCVFAQTIPPQYYILTKSADSLYKVKNFKASAFKYSEAFKTLGGKGLVNDRYNAACSWARAGYSDSSFFNLERIVFKTFYTDYDHVVKDKDLLSLHKRKRWKPLLTKIKHNQDSIEGKMDKKLVALLDSLVTEDQKWRVLDIRFKNGSIPKDSIELSKIERNLEKTDSLNSFEARRIFYKYGFPNYDLVGQKGSSDFWLLVQHHDMNPLFQDSVLTVMKIETEKGKASRINYAYLIDRVKVNKGENQIYGTQMQINGDSTSFEPKPLVEPEKLNERRKSVGLGTIEEYIEEMKSRYYGGLKKK